LLLSEQCERRNERTCAKRENQFAAIVHCASMVGAQYARLIQAQAVAG